MYLARIHELDPIGGYTLEVLVDGVWTARCSEDDTKNVLDRCVWNDVGIEDGEPIRGMGHTIRYIVIEE